MLLSMLLVALLGQPAFESAASGASAPARPTIEISLAEALRALPAGTASGHGSFVPDDGSSGDTPPILPSCLDCVAVSPADSAFAFIRSAKAGERRLTANQARAPPAA